MVVFCGSPWKHDENQVGIVAGQPFMQHAVIVCGHCRHLRCYDRDGQPWAIPGSIYTDQFVRNSDR